MNALTWSWYKSYYIHLAGFYASIMPNPRTIYPMRPTLFCHEKRNAFYPFSFYLKEFFPVQWLLNIEVCIFFSSLQSLHDSLLETFRFPLNQCSEKSHYISLFSLCHFKFLARKETDHYHLVRLSFGLQLSVALSANIGGLYHILTPYACQLHLNFSVLDNESIDVFLYDLLFTCKFAVPYVSW